MSSTQLSTLDPHSGLGSHRALTCPGELPPDLSGLLAGLQPYHAGRGTTARQPTQRSQIKRTPRNKRNQLSTPNLHSERSTQLNSTQPPSIIQYDPIQIPEKGQGAAGDISTMSTFIVRIAEESGESVKVSRWMPLSVNWRHRCGESGK